VSHPKRRDYVQWTILFLLLTYGYREWYVRLSGSGTGRRFWLGNSAVKTSNCTTADCRYRFTLHLTRAIPMSANPNHLPASDRREREPALIGPDVERLLRSYQEHFQAERAERVANGKSFTQAPTGTVTSLSSSAGRP
jgi:hypothetical protein